MSNSKSARSKQSPTLSREFNWEEAREYFNYDPLTGIVTWAKDRVRAKAGEVAGTLCDTLNGKVYMNMCFNRKMYKQHRFIYGWMTGALPPNGSEIDHIDGDGLNNRWDNLRICSRSQNQSNRAWKSNEQGFKGVSKAYKKGRKFVVRVNFEGKTHRLYGFDTAEDAYEAYKKLARSVQGDFCRLD